MPDVGDDDGVASGQVSSNQLWSQSHEHRGPAQGEPPQLDADSIALTQALDMNGQGTTDQAYVGLVDPAAASIPTRSVRYEDGTGFVLRAENGIDATIVTNSGAINTSSGNGIRGDYGGANTADVRHDAGLQRYLMAETDGTDGMPLPSQVLMGSLLLRPRLEDATAGVALETDSNMQADAPGVTRTVRWPAASAFATYATAGLTPQVALSATGSWTPVFRQVNNGVNAPSYSVQIGNWSRILNIVFVDWQISYSGFGATDTVARIDGLPFTVASGGSRFGGQILASSPTLGDHVFGVATNGTTQIALTPIDGATTIPTAGTVRGSLWYVAA